MKEALQEIFNEEKELYWIPPKDHHEHHRVLGNWLWAVNLMKRSALIAFVGGLVTGFGFIVWLGIKAVLKAKGGFVG